MVKKSKLRKGLSRFTVLLKRLLVSDFRGPIYKLRAVELLILVGGRWFLLFGVPWTV